MAAAQFEPLEPYSTALAKWHMRCLKCGKDFHKRYNSVQQGTGCPYCANGGLDLTGPALVYVITHPEHRAHKVGVMGTETDRLRRHGREGWLTYKVHSVATGIDAYRMEQLVLNILRNDRGLPPALSESEMPQAGWTETVSADEIDLPDLWELICDAAERLFGE